MEFRTTAGSETVNAHGEIQPDGSFRLTTYEPGDGAIEGEHRAIVVSPTIPDGVAASAPAFPARYASYDTSRLTYKINPQPNEIAIQLEAK